MNSQKKMISKEELLSELWQHSDYRENSLTQSISELRLALGDSAKNSSFVKTFPQRGYQWVCELSEQSITVDNDENKQQVQRVQEPTIAIKRGISSLITWAYFELGNTSAAIKVLKSFKEKLPQLWQTQDTKRLAQYQFYY